MKEIKVDKLFIKLENSLKSFFGLLGRNKLKVFLALVGVLALSGAIYAASGGSFNVGSANIPAGHTSSMNGLIGYWKLDETSGAFADSSGNGYTGTQAGGVTYNQSGILNRSVKFDDVDDQISISSDWGNNLTNVTFSMWANVQSVADGDWLFSRDNIETYILIKADGAVRFRHNDLSVSLTDTSVSAFPFGSWAHLVITYNGAQVKIYINGVEVKSANVTGTITYASNTTYIGRNTGNESQRTNGFIDDVRIYSRALSATEVNRLYNTGQNKVNASQNAKVAGGLVGLWSFDGADIYGTNVINKAGPDNGVNTGTAEKAPGKIGQSLYFDGTNDYVVVTDSDNLDVLPYPNGEMTVALWAKPELTSALPSNPSGLIAKKIINATNGNWNLWIRGGAQNGLIFRFDTATEGLVDMQPTVSQYDMIMDGSWHHLAAVIRRTGMSYLYIDGENVGSYDFSSLTGVLDNANNMILGTTDTSFNAKYKGYMDEVRMYSRALSDAEMKRLYEMGESKLNTTQNTKLTDGLVSYWSFNGTDIYGTNVIDSAGANNGSMMWMATSTPTGGKVSGKVGQGLIFDGGDDYVKIPDHSSLDLSNYSVSLWLKNDKYVQYAGILTKTTSSWTSANYIIMLDTTGTKIRMEVNSGAADGASINLGRWYHVVMTHDGTTARLYVNGVYNVSLARAPATNAADIFIGRYSNTWFRGFQGSIDEVRIYNRALSASEVTRLYNMGK